MFSASQIPVSLALVPYHPEAHPLAKAKASWEKQQDSLMESSFKEQIVTLKLPEEIKLLLPNTLFYLHRRIESEYRTLPWPPSMQKIFVFTHVKGGRGDIAASAKVIALMQRICPSLIIDWALSDAGDQYNPSSFLKGSDPSKIYIRNWRKPSADQEPADLLLIGPVKMWGKDYIVERSARKVLGPTFCFAEIAEEARNGISSTIMQFIVQKASPEESVDQIYHSLHPILFPSESPGADNVLSMGLQPGSGLLLDSSRIQAHLSRGYCCPSYLLEIQDKELRQDILNAMGALPHQSLLDYDRYSFNSGYAHRPASWGKFIDCVAIHERHKSVVIVLNHYGEFDKPSPEEFCNRILTPERQAFLTRKGYGKINFQGQKLRILKHDNSPGKRELTVIVRPSFLPADMRSLQLASERLLATGDNSAIEAWCSRCKLYVYEDVGNGGCKDRFLEQQVDLAKTISPNLSKLLALFGGDKRLAKRSLNQPLDKEQMEELEKLLITPDLGEATLQFCHHIIDNYSFSDAFEGAIKRTAWHHLIPNLALIEEEMLDKEFRADLIAYIKDPQTSGKTALNVRNLSRIGKRIHKLTADYIFHNPHLPRAPMPPRGALSRSPQKTAESPSICTIA